MTLAQREDATALARRRWINFIELRLVVEDTIELVVDACMRPAHRVTCSVRNLTFEHGAPAFTV
jgi:hypothetical protein